ncbi:MAG: S8 family serine peptidase, partial [Bacillota bacterium]
QQDGERQSLTLVYPSVRAQFVRMSGFSGGPFVLQSLKADGSPIDIGADRPVVLRTVDDLRLLDRFWGLANVSLEKLDLSGQEKVLRSMTFDTRTLWPPANRLPEGFDPQRILEEGKHPGLGIRALHAQGIDGRGVRVAIIDQPLLRNHREYADRLAVYENQVSGNVPPQMHAPPVASIAVGKSVGVAPEATLAFFSVPMWSKDNRPYCTALERILQLNESAKPAERIRVVSISTGMFPAMDNYDLWKQTLEKATRSGVLVITCDPACLRYGSLNRVPGRDPEDPRSYTRGRWISYGMVLLVPTNRTVASHEGPDVYTYWGEGGLSWAAPYLAGLAALAHQIHPDLEPQKVKDLLVQTAAKTDAGPVVNPAGFIAAVRKLP